MGIKLELVVQLTPPRSARSIALGKGLTRMAPGSLDNVQVVVTDIEEAYEDLRGRGIEVTEIQDMPCMTSPVPGWPPSAMVSVLPTAALAPDSSTTWWLVENRWFFDRSAMVWSRVGTRVPSTMSTVALANRLRGSSGCIASKSSYPEAAMLSCSPSRLVLGPARRGSGLDAREEKPCRTPTVQSGRQPGGARVPEDPLRHGVGTPGATAAHLRPAAYLSGPGVTETGFLESLGGDSVPGVKDSSRPSAATTAAQVPTAPTRSPGPFTPPGVAGFWLRK